MSNHAFWKIIYGLLGLLGLLLMNLQVRIYRLTIIDIYIPIAIILVIGMLTFGLNRTHYKRTYHLKNDVFPFLQNIVSWGFIVCYVFMAVNFYFADKQTMKYRFAIVEKSSMTGPKHHRSERKPLVTIDYFEYEKKLVFSYEETDRVNMADSVLVTVKKGGLGFDVLQDYGVFD